MSGSQWHKFYTASVAATPEVVFGLLADMPNYGRWLPGSAAYGQTTAVDPYPVQLGSRYHDGKPGQPGKDWYGTVTGFQPPGSLDFHHVIHVSQLRATIDVHIHYSLEREGDRTRVNRWLVLDFSMPFVVRPLRRAITGSFDRENVRTLAALTAYTESSASKEIGPVREQSS
jgi:Polyketide cyclase / dehydrase and lipid transport